MRSKAPGGGNVVRSNEGEGLISRSTEYSHEEVHGLGVRHVDTVCTVGVSLDFEVHPFIVVMIGDVPSFFGIEEDGKIV